MRLELPPLCLYVHLPWCVRKCPYCDFNSHVAPELIPQAQYVDALLDDLSLDLPAVQGRLLAAIFFGGGTPSLFSPQSIERLLAGVRRQVAFDPAIEVTLEANPGTIEHGRFQDYRGAGINRISLGAQTFNTEQLRLLGRIHGSADIGRAVEELARAGLDNFNLDLMYGLPQQTPAQALEDLAAALALGPVHVSHYQLTLEPGTVFYHRPPPLPDAEVTWQMQLDCQEQLAAHGFEQYEVSAYARRGRRSRHNLNYWEFGDYIGIGAGAHGKLSMLPQNESPGHIVRTVRARQPRDYLGRSALERLTTQQPVAPVDLPFEYMLNVLRLVEGFDEHAFEARCGLPFSAVRSTIERAQQRGLLEHDGPTHWKPTEIGRRFLNDLQALFLPETLPPTLAPRVVGAG